MRLDEHNDVNKNSEPVKYLARNIEHEFSWYVLTTAPKYLQRKKELNDVLMLFRNGVLGRYIFQ